MLTGNGGANPLSSGGFQSEDHTASTKGMMVRNYADEERLQNPIDAMGGTNPRRLDIGKVSSTRGPANAEAKFGNGPTAR